MGGLRRAIRTCLVLALALALGRAPAAPAERPRLPALGAQGGGSLARGGRAGAVMQVTSLADAGPGTLRACVEGRGPRVCVFRTGGTIALRTPLRVAEPYLTVAGETAPGDGVQLDGRGAAGGVLRLESHDLVLTGLKIRPGYRPGKAGDGVAAVCGDEVHDVWVDHNTIQWATNKAVALWGLRGAPRAVTFSYNIIAETLAAQSVNILVGSDNGDVPGDRFLAGRYADRMRDIDFHHNYILNASHRNPLLKNGSSRFVNNIVFNWGWYAMELGGGIEADVVGNVFARGPLWREGAGLPHEILAFPATARNGTTAAGVPSLYLAGNLGPHRRDPSVDDFAMTRLTDTRSGAGGENGRETDDDASRYRRGAPLPLSPPGARPIAAVAPTPADLASRAGPLGALVFSSVGATRRLGCAGGFTRRADDQERRLIESYPAGGIRALVRDEAAVGGYPRLAAGTPCPDADGDGLPDAYEDAHGLDRRDPGDARALRADGYTALERYLAGE